MKRNPRRCPGSPVLPLIPLALVAACIAPAQDLGQPWPAREGTSSAVTRPPGEGASAQTSPRTPGDPAMPAGEVAVETAPVPGDPEPLLAWDGGVVAGPAAGTVTEAEGARRDLGKPGDRWRIIELYQTALRERDVLAREVATLSAALDEANTRLAESTAKGQVAESRAGALQAELEELRGENEQLAARLATAQIRRLEAEKMLLEARIEAHRRQEQNGGDVAMGTER